MMAASANVVSHMALPGYLSMELPLVKYGRWNNRRWDEDVDYQSSDESRLILRIQMGELVIKQGKIILDVLNLTAGHTQIKGISKGAALCIYVNHGEFYRKFRVKFAQHDGIEDFKHCFHLVNILKRFFYIKHIEDETSHFLDEPGEFVDIRPVTWTNENCFDIPEAGSCLLACSGSDLEESIIATLLDPTTHDICNQINDIINLW